ncbi:unnamed protein product [Arctogadus glacialis]
MSVLIVYCSFKCTFFTWTTDDEVADKLNYTITTIITYQTLSVHQTSLPDQTSTGPSPPGLGGMCLRRYRVGGWSPESCWIDIVKGFQWPPVRKARYKCSQFPSTDPSRGGARER